MMKATNILWDVDNKEDLDFLPEEVDLPDALRDEDDISDYLSDLTGYCHFGFKMIDKNKAIIGGEQNE